MSVADPKSGKSLVLIVSLMGLPIILILIGVGPTVSKGTKGSFNCDSLEYKIESEITCFDGDFRLWKYDAEMRSNSLIDMLLLDGFIQKSNQDRRRWGLVFYWNSGWKDGYGPYYGFLFRYRAFLEKWTKAHREMAKIFWPEAFRFLRSEREVERNLGLEMIEIVWQIENLVELRALIFAFRGRI